MRETAAASGDRDDGPTALPPLGEDEFLLRHLPGNSERMSLLRAWVAIVNLPSNSDLVKLICLRGPSGAGKNYLAKVIAAHRRWQTLQFDKANDPGIDSGIEAYAGRFNEIHLPALPDTLIESELFGHKKGAFTGATDDRKGLLAGDYDDILLDEIGDASPALQAKLLAVLDGRPFRAVGAGPAENVTTSARLIVATNQDLRMMMLAGRFREDLYWRAMDFVFHVPSLSEQPENIEPILRKIEGELLQLIPASLDKPPSLTDADIRWARGYSWRGNIRELRHALKRRIIHGGRKSLKDVVQEIQGELGAPEGAADQGVVNELVRSRMDGVLDGKQKSPGTLENLLKEFVHKVQKGFVQWYDEVKPGKEVLKSLLPGHSNQNSIVTKVSKWRGGR